MRVAIYYSNRDIRIVEQSVPTIGPGELLVQIQASGICGSDVMEWYRSDKVPREGLAEKHSILGRGRQQRRCISGGRPGSGHPSCSLLYLQLLPQGP